ncbi:MAG TPA: hypothetical protein VMM35_05415 [Longimicrobiales bacterium]|nr:hypothetical protein [Longimicrobiales bacterium]
MKPFAKWLVWTSSIATVLTGVVYFWMDRMMSPVDEFAVINHPLQPLVLKVHILVAPLLVFAIGVIAVDHIWKYFRGTIRRGRRTGLTAMWPVFPMVVTGYLIQGITQVVWLEVVAWAHIVTGVAYALGVVAHHLAVRHSRLVTLEMRGPPELGTGRVPPTTEDRPRDPPASAEERRRTSGDRGRARVS